MSGDEGLENSIKNIFDMTEAFTESGECDDEITLVFDNSNKLYVSKNFLRYASPVFKAMFDHDWQEKKENLVSLTGKNYNDFSNFCYAFTREFPNRLQVSLNISHIKYKEDQNLINYFI
jgi:hypothetical protein